jgi:hypothetical protein
VATARALAASPRESQSQSRSTYMSHTHSPSTVHSPQQQRPMREREGLKSPRTAGESESRERQCRGALRRPSAIGSLARTTATSSTVYDRLDTTRHSTPQPTHLRPPYGVFSLGREREFSVWAPHSFLVGGAAAAAEQTYKHRLHRSRPQQAGCMVCEGKARPRRGSCQSPNWRPKKPSTSPRPVAPQIGSQKAEH